MSLAINNRIPANVCKAFASFESTGKLDPASVRTDMQEQDQYTAMNFGVFAMDVIGQDERSGIDKAMNRRGEVEINRAEVPADSDAASFPYKTLYSTYQADAQGHFSISSAVTTEADQPQYLFFQSPQEGVAKYAIATVEGDKTSIEAGYINQNPGQENYYKESLQLT